MKDLGSEYDLEERLIDFALRVAEVTESLPNSPLGKHIVGQLLRAGTAAAPNYAEAQGAESRRDFVHKMRIALKELRETKVWLKMIAKKPLIEPKSRLELIIQECDELTAIFVTSIKTAQENSKP